MAKLGALTALYLKHGAELTVSVSDGRWQAKIVNGQKTYACASAEIDGTPSISKALRAIEGALVQVELAQFATKQGAA
jgi:hypothetical protein